MAEAIRRHNAEYAGVDLTDSAALRRALARFDVEVFDSDGGTLRYDDETQARMALLDAEFRAWDGLDEEDAALLGFDLEEVEPPRGDSDEEILPRMVAKLPSRH